MEGDWSCYKGGQVNGGRMVMLWRPFWIENGHVTEMAILEAGGQFNSHVTEVEWLLQRWSL